MLEEIKLLFNKETKTKYEENKEIINKTISSVKKQAIEKAKPEKCYIFGKECTSFCNSHSVPRACLKNIANNGKVFQSMILDRLPIAKSDLGLNEAGTFHIICNECDNNCFKEYENEENYTGNLPSSVQMAQIATKNLLLIIGKRLVEKELYSMLDEISLYFDFNNSVSNTELDLYEYGNSFIRSKQALNGNHDKYFYCFYYRKLDYVVPYACQSSIALETDLEDNILNQVYNQSSDIRIQSMHVAVLPFSNFSVVMMFIDTLDKKYRRFYKQFNKLDEDDKLAVLNYIVFAYTENVFISKKLDDRIYDNEELIDICAGSSTYIMDNIREDPTELSKKARSFERRHNIPNLLLREYSIQNI